MAGNREAFLSRVREAAAGGRRYRVRTLEAFPDGVGYVGGGTDLVESLAAEFEAVGGYAHRVASDDEARAVLRQILDGHRAAVERPEDSAPLALRWEHPLLERIGVEALLEEVGFQVVPWSEGESTDAEHVGPVPTGRIEEGLASRDPEEVRTNRPVGTGPTSLFRAVVGISSVDWAVAETGSLVVAARPGQGRSVSLLPPVHVAVVERSQIVPDLFDLFTKLEAEKPRLPSNLVLITGPSKTGDIELKLTTGVHGPGEVHVVILDEPGGS